MCTHQGLISLSYTVYFSLICVRVTSHIYPLNFFGYEGVSMERSTKKSFPLPQSIMTNMGLTTSHKLSVLYLSKTQNKKGHNIIIPWFGALHRSRTHHVWHTGTGIVRYHVHRQNNLRCMVLYGTMPYVLYYLKASIATNNNRYCSWFNEKVVPVCVGTLRRLFL